MTAYERRVIPGGAPKMTLVSGLTTTTDLAFTVDSVPGTVPTTGPGFLLVDRGVAGEECVRWLARSGTSFTLSSTADRGVAGTTAAAHTPGSSTVEFAYAATDFDEANYTVAETIGQVSGKGTALLGSGANALTPVTPAVDGTADGESLVVDHTRASGWKVANPVPAPHEHPESDVTALIAGLDGKMANPRTPWAKGSMLVGTDASAFDVIPAGGQGSVPTVQADGSIAFGAAPGRQAQVFTTSGTFTVPTGVKEVSLLIIGGGNGGAGGTTSAHGALTAGAFAGVVDHLPVTPGAAIAVTIGAGGAGGLGSGTNTPNATGLGTASTFGSLATSALLSQTLLGTASITNPVGVGVVTASGSGLVPWSQMGSRLYYCTTSATVAHTTPLPLSGYVTAAAGSAGAASSDAVAGSAAGPAGFIGSGSRTAAGIGPGAGGNGGDAVAGTGGNGGNAAPNSGAVGGAGGFGTVKGGDGGAGGSGLVIVAWG